MSAYLGYDRDLVAMLRQAMRGADEELAAIRCSDVDGQSGMQVIAQARTTLSGTWLPFLDGLLQCRAMEGYTPTTIDPGDLINSSLIAVAAERGWTLVTDPLPSAAGPAGEAMTVAAARALGEALSGRPGEDRLTGDEVWWLQGRLAEISVRPELAAGFLPALTSEGWVNVCNQLGATRQHAVTEALLFDHAISAAEHDEWTRIDAVFAALGRAVQLDHLGHPECGTTLPLAGMSPYAAGLLVQYLGLDAEALATVARELIERERVDLVYPEETNLGPRAADLLMTTILATPTAATRYVVGTADDPGLVLDAAFDPTLGNQLMIEATDPATMTDDQARVVIPRLVGWVLDKSTSATYLGYNPLLAVAAADLIAPYLLPILRPDADSYAMSTKERSAIALLMVDNNAALDHLLAARARIAVTFNTAISDPEATFADRKRAAHDLAGLLAILDTMARSADIRSAEREVAEYEVTWSVIGSGTGAVSSLGEGAVAAIGGSAGTALRAVTEWFGLQPTSVADVRAASLNHFDVVTTVAAASVIGATFDAMVAAGRIPPGTSLPPLPDLGQEHVGVAYAHDFNAWLDEFDGAEGVDPAAAEELDAIKQTIASDHESAADANTELLGG